MSKLVLEQVTKTFGEFYAAREISFCAEEGGIRDSAGAKRLR